MFSIESKQKMQNGFTLIEVSISLAIIAIIAMLTANLTQMFLKELQSIQTESEISTLTQSVGMILNHRSSCTDSLEGQKSVGDIRIYEPGSNKANVVVEGGKKVGRVMVNKVELIDLTTIDVNRKLAKVNLEIERPSPAQKMTKSFVVQLQASADGSIESCWSHNDSSSLCLELGGTFDPSATPSCILPKKYEEQICPSGQVANGFDATGKLSCINKPGGGVTATFSPCKVEEVVSTGPCGYAQDIAMAKCDPVTGDVYIRAIRGLKNSKGWNGLPTDTGWTKGEHTMACALRHKTVVCVTATLTHSGGQVRVNAVVVDGGSQILAKCSSVNFSQ